MLKHMLLACLECEMCIGRKEGLEGMERNKMIQCFACCTYLLFIRFYLLCFVLQGRKRPFSRRLSQK